MGLPILDHDGKLVTHGRQRLENGVRLHYYTAGSGPALILQHGVSLFTPSILLHVLAPRARTKSHRRNPAIFTF
jgi:hypothetical protein